MCLIFQVQICLPKITIYREHFLNPKSHKDRLDELFITLFSRRVKLLWSIIIYWDIFFFYFYIYFAVRLVDLFYQHVFFFFFLSQYIKLGIKTLLPWLILFGINMTRYIIFHAFSCIKFVDLENLITRNDTDIIQWVFNISSKNGINWFGVNCHNHILFGKSILYVTYVRRSLFKMDIW